MKQVRTGFWALWATVILTCGSPARTCADETLRWGGDKEGGAPYLIEQGNHLGGFEGDLVAYLLKKLNKTGQFVQAEWALLPDHLHRGDIDLILNGYEWTPEREQTMASTIPYYIYRLRLIVRRDDAGPEAIHSWADLRRPGKKPRVGVLKNTSAHRYLEREFKGLIEIDALGDEGSTGAMLSVRQGRMAATVQDEPAARYYVGRGREFPDLAAVDEAIEPGYYVMFVREKDRPLREAINTALMDAMKDGTLRKIYEKYDLWNDEMNQLPDLARDWPPHIGAAGGSMAEFGSTLGQAALVTVLLSFLSMPLAMAIGLLVALGRLYGPRWLDWLLAAYVEVLRGTPLLLQLYVIYFVLPEIGIRLSAFTAGVLGLAINYSAYEAENYRAGLLAIPRGQMEACLALGMSLPTALRRVIVPQAVRVVIPPVTNDFIALFKDTSVCSVVAVTELTGQYRSLSTNHPNMVLQLLLMTAVLYLLMSYPLSLVARRLEQVYSRAIV